MNATDLNVGVLAELVTYYRGLTSFPNRIPADLTGAHLKRCQKAGLFIVTGNIVTLTETGIARVIRSMEDRLRTLAWRIEGEPRDSYDEKVKAGLLAMRDALAVIKK